jgi:putative transposase
MSDQPNPEERRIEIALFRYTLILPLVRGQYSPGGKGRLRQQIAAGHYDIPYSSRHTVSTTTLGRWERRYREQGFEGLKPKPRRDKGQPRAISPQTIDRAEALKREQPHRSARSVADILSLDHTNPIPEARLAPRTLRRHLAQRGATTAQLP